MVFWHIKVGGGVRANVPFGTKKCFFLLEASLNQDRESHLHIIPMAGDMCSFIPFNSHPGALFAIFFTDLPRQRTLPSLLHPEAEGGQVLPPGRVLLREVPGRVVLVYKILLIF